MPVGVVPTTVVVPRRNVMVVLVSHVVGESIHSILSRKVCANDARAVRPAHALGRIMGLAGARKLYTTSNGGVTLRATTHIEVIHCWLSLLLLALVLPFYRCCCVSLWLLPGCARHDRLPGMKASAFFASTRGWNACVSTEAAYICGGGCCAFGSRPAVVAMVDEVRVDESGHPRLWFGRFLQHVLYHMYSVLNTPDEAVMRGFRRSRASPETTTAAVVSAAASTTSAKRFRVGTCIIVFGCVVIFALSFSYSQVIEAKGRSKRNAVVVTELPYQVNKSALLQRMAEMVNDKKVGGRWGVGRNRGLCPCVRHSPAQLPFHPPHPITPVRSV